ncbi:hypothetical protein JX265_014014 [Neoarthrinium moseri]|uniref:Uncharacterized protein n=1 Tax=Neoarthrinium moseri TaxID=1658444 RepID=A0A9P9W7J1_9PEZI|nr:hypothetical protein JX265_014014 [Neoarthrinium moseri]
MSTFEVKGKPRRFWLRRTLKPAAPNSKPSPSRENVSSQPSVSADSFITIIRATKTQLGLLAATNKSFASQYSKNSQLSLVFTSSLGAIQVLAEQLDQLLVLIESTSTGWAAVPAITNDNELAREHPQEQACTAPESFIFSATGASGGSRTYVSKQYEKDIPSESDSDSDSVFDDESDNGSDIDTYTGRADNQNSGYEYYNQLISKYEEEGPTMANRGERTDKMIAAEAAKWQQFCEVIQSDKEVKRSPYELLKRCHAPTFKSYLNWRCNNSRIKKESSIITYWKVLSMFYCNQTKNWVDGGVLFDINNWIPIGLTPLKNLDTSVKDKSGLYVADLDLMLHHHWVLDQEVLAHGRLRVQIALALILAGATSTRPSALIENLRYRDVEFHVFRPHPGGKRARIGMVVRLTKVKRTAGESRPTKYGFHEEGTLLRDPILYMQSLAFADHAFAVLDSSQDIYDLIIPQDTDRIVLPWKPEWFDRFVFREIRGRGCNTYVDVDKALQYGKARNCLIRLGRKLGYQKQLEWYDLRRGSGKKLHEALTKEEADRSMGHTGGSSTYSRFYTTDYREADFQEIVFGSEPQRDIIQLMGRLLRHGAAPRRLSEDDKKAINQDRVGLSLPVTRITPDQQSTDWPGSANSRKACPGITYKEGSNWHRLELFHGTQGRAHHIYHGDDVGHICGPKFSGMPVLQRQDG